MISFFHALVDYILHLDVHLVTFVNLWGYWTYPVLFLIIFCQTALVFAAFLPGDTLLFAAGTIAGLSPESLNISLLFILLFTAAVVGNNLNYFLGRYAGPKIFQHKFRLMNRNHLVRAHQFCEQHGSLAIILGLFIPVIRTFVPFVAGIGYMTFWRFLLANLLGAFVWTGSLLFGSYLFGNVPVIRNHFSLVMIGIISLSCIPPLVGALRKKRHSAENVTNV
jgi:membrane-associated protein